MMIVDNEFEIGQVIYLKTDPDQNPRIVTSFRIYKGGEILYSLNFATSESYHYSFEISTEKDYSKTN